MVLAKGTNGSFIKAGAASQVWAEIVFVFAAPCPTHMETFTPPAHAPAPETHGKQCISFLNSKKGSECHWNLNRARKYSKVEDLTQLWEPQEPHNTLLSARNQMQALNWHHIKLLKNWQAEHPESTISLVTHPETGTVLSLICCLLLSEIGFWWCKSPTIFWSFLCVCHAYLGCSFLNCTPSTILSETPWRTEQDSQLCFFC